MLHPGVAEDLSMHPHNFPSKLLAALSRSSCVKHDLRHILLSHFVSEGCCQNPLCLAVLEMLLAVSLVSLFDIP